MPGDENSVDDGEFDDEVGEDEEDASDFDDDDDLDDEDDDDGEEANEGPGLEYLYKKDLNDEGDDIEYRASSRKLASKRNIILITIFLLFLISFHCF